MTDNIIHWEFVEWAEKECYEAFLNGVDEDGLTYEAVGIMGAGEIQEVKDIEFTKETKIKLSKDLMKESVIFGHNL